MIPERAEVGNRDAFDIDLFDSGYYDAKVFRTAPLWEGLQEDCII